MTAASLLAKPDPATPLPSGFLNPQLQGRGFEKGIRKCLEAIGAEGYVDLGPEGYCIDAMASMIDGVGRNVDIQIRYHSDSYMSRAELEAIVTKWKRAWGVRVEQVEVLNSHEMRDIKVEDRVLMVITSLGFDEGAWELAESDASSIALADAQWIQEQLKKVGSSLDPYAEMVRHIVRVRQMFASDVRIAAETNEQRDERLKGIDIQPVLRRAVPDNAGAMVTHGDPEAELLELHRGAVYTWFERVLLALSCLEARGKVRLSAGEVAAYIVDHRIGFAPGQDLPSATAAYNAVAHVKHHDKKKASYDRVLPQGQHGAYSLNAYGGQLARSLHESRRGHPSDRDDSQAVKSFCALHDGVRYSWIHRVLLALKLMDILGSSECGPRDVAALISKCRIGWTGDTPEGLENVYSNVTQARSKYPSLFSGYWGRYALSPAGQREVAELTRHRMARRGGLERD